MVDRPLSELKLWDKNPKEISKKGYERLKEQLKLGQHSTLLIMPDGLVLGGNQRLRAMLEMGFESAKCLIVDFVKEEEGWIGVMEGEPQRSQFFETKEKAMLAYSLSHNDNVGFY